MKYEMVRMRLRRRVAAGLVGVAALVTAIAVLANKGQDFGTANLLIRSAQVNADFTQVTLPLFSGTSGGQTVYYVITDSSDQADASVRQVNYAPKLANAKGTAAVQIVTVVNGVVNFPATVDFSPTRVLTPGPTGFPPAVAQPGAVGGPGYSPLIEMPNGIVLNAPQIARDANGDGQIDLQTEAADKVVSINIAVGLVEGAAGQVTYRLTSGFYDNRNVHYASFDSSSQVAAAIEDVTWAPKLDAAPSVGNESQASAREGLIAFTNGQTGLSNPQRQGLSSAILDGVDPLNTLHEVEEGQSDPGFPVYSPLWDIRLAEWTPAAVSAGLNTRQTDFGTELGLVAQGLVTGPGGAPFGASGFIVNCPPVILEPGM
jgi:hypothetical protein